MAGKVYKRKTYKKKYVRKARVFRTPGEANMNHFDTTSMPINIAGNATSQFEMAPFAIVEGTDFNQRQGRKIRIYKAEMWCQFVPTANSIQPNGDSIRCVVVLDSEVRGVTFTGGDVFDSASPLTFYNASKVPSRFKVLADMAHPLIPTSTLSGVTESVAFVPIWKETFYNKFTINYTGNSGTIADIQDYSIRAVAISSNGNGVVVGTMQMNVRYWFKSIQ